ncbi:MAG: CoA transferase [Rhodospirillaceae bacterium]|jgi:crotonobetainyl-CoA:carnitine CoA-transferase CaiB-like acyl-CoA transferase|nr:CoA transferase [Rhodospirillaceae bacterium]MBT3910033.1 CoA transferase [Rhodospirillaceae bacterium]MBT6884132.1 CoA transferase [Rhodospirillaceae bacterium]
MKQNKHAMAGVRVLDAATFIAAPYAAAIMGEFGAEVIKIENPNGGDPWRRYGTDSGQPNQSLAWLTEARNKKSITLNLRAPEGAALFKRLVETADVVCENFRPGTLEKWGIGWTDLKAINSGLIMMRISGYGQTGPYKDRPGFARIAHAVGGLTYLSGIPGETPVTPGSTSLGDYMSGMYGAIGILMALRHRDATGEGQMVDMALYESVFRALDEIVPRYAKDGFVREPEGTGTVNACPHGHFPTGDGKFLSIACTTDKMFERLTQAMVRPDLWENFGDQQTRLAARVTVIDEVTQWTTSMSRDEVMAACVAAEVPSGPINSIADIFADPHFRARDDLLAVNVPTIGEVTVPGVYPKLSATPGSVDSLGPELGNANEEVYGGQLGLSADDMAALKDKGVI